MRLLHFDETTEGLSPFIVREVEALAVADRCYVVDPGAIVFEGTPDELRGNAEVSTDYLHV